MDIIITVLSKCGEENKYLGEISTESSRQMRGAGKALREYISEQPAESFVRVGADGTTSVICQGYMRQTEQMLLYLMRPVV